MAHHAYLFINESLHELNAFVSTFEFDCFCAAFLHESQRISDCIVVASVKSPIGHVGNKQCALHCSSNCLQMDQYLLERDRHRIAISEHYISETVADENDVDPRLVNDTSGRVIVRCQTNEPFATLFT